MKEQIRVSVEESNTLDDVRDNLFAVFRDLREQGHTRIGYISGAITADGLDNIVTANQIPCFCTFFR